MFDRLRAQNGITIVETTVVLSVLFILAGAMSPIVSESVTTARAVRAKNDASLIAAGLINFQKDVGADAGGYGTSMLAQALALPHVLKSQGSEPKHEEDQATAPDAAPGLAPLVSVQAARRATRPRAHHCEWSEAGDLLDDHLITNRRGYRMRRPGEYGGWNGPYLSLQIKGDPWGSQYLINSSHLDGGSSSADSSGRPRRAVFVISPGANGAVETPFDQPITEARAHGDDIVIRIQ